MKKMFTVVLMLAVLVATSATFAQPFVKAHKAANAPVIDGEMDAIWKNATENFVLLLEANPPDDDYDMLGSWRMMWDDENLYVLFTALDDEIFTDHANAWENDSFEMYFDADNSKGVEYDEIDDIQTRFSFHYETSEDVDHWYGNKAEWDFSTDGIELGTIETQLGWQKEVSIPLENLQIDPEIGWIFGFNCQVNDNDGENRETIAQWSFEGATYAFPENWGEVELSGVVVSDAAPVLMTETAPTIDGELDDLWLDKPLFSSNSYAWDTAAQEWWDPMPVIDSWDDHYFTWQAMWDMDNLYIFIDKFDDEIVNDHANPWEQDGVEFYFDGDYSQQETFDGIDDLQIRFNNWYETTDDITTGYGTGTSWEFPVENVNFAGVETETGFTMEIAMPLADLSVGAEAGWELGFEIQSNDNDTDARDAERKWWSASNHSWDNPSIWGTLELVGGATGVKSESQTVSDFSLEQNYPNPFNPATQIRYTVSQQGLVKLTVYDLLGHAVASLVDTHQPAGVYSVQFNASDLASGVYLYKLETGSQVLTRKMILTQ